MSRLWEYGEDFIDLVLQFYKRVDIDIKQRSYRWWIYHNINLIEYGYEKKKISMMKRGYRNLKHMYKNRSQ